MLKQIDYWLKGYIRVKITGRSLERLINLLIEEKIELWDVMRIEGQLYTNIKLEDIEPLKDYLQRINCQYEVISYHGLPNLVKRSLNRKFIIIGIITFISLIYVLSSFIFFIEIKGTEKVENKVLKEQLAELKVRPGVLKSSIPLENLEEIIIQKNRHIAWAHLYFQGTKLVLEVVEKKIIETKVKPSDLIAEDSGVITELIVFRGTAKVEEGETVKQGQILISQEVKTVTNRPKEEQREDIIEGIKKVKAAGIVKAKVWYEGYGEAALVKTFTQPTSDIQKSIILKYENREIILSGPKKPPYNHFFIKENIKRLAQWRNISFPLEIITKKYIKLRKIRVKRTIGQVKKLAKEKAVESILQQLAKEVIIMNSDLKLIEFKEDNLLRVKAVVEVEKDIAIRRE
ncbi:sporulation protein YqfD [Halanaerobacter jeridensis]|uniref:Stage IV sporulation protein n=1 Tax=Halanaerobacter jeridensis TaxID=706427 RepID=A0A938XRQ9_9FIRM|nr:sporulation protein YqfD [Halanaerobacter jeridensis]MBM7556240.1 hypothetical protein [Halanaerobacter jeridensis]